MSLHLPTRRVLRTAPTILKTLRPTPTPSLPILQTQTRHASGPQKMSRNFRQAQRYKPESRHVTSLGDLTVPEERKAVESKLREQLMSTPLESESIFQDELQAVSAQEEDDEDEPSRPARKPAAKTKQSTMGASLLADHMRMATDPDPGSRKRWERKMVIREVTRALSVSGRETRDERIRRTERQLLSKSSWLPTSTKKLMHLARQISGKTLEEARTQMRFSKKKMAKEVLFELDLARDKAIVERGMGLGKFNGEFDPEKAEKKTIKDYRHGKFVNVVDPTRLYVAESWVNKGPWRGFDRHYRAKGRVDLIKKPNASISIRLKEEKTRVREFEEKKAKEYRQGPWIHLPDRPVTAQRPFYSW